MHKKPTPQEQADLMRIYTPAFERCLAVGVALSALRLVVPTSRGNWYFNGTDWERGMTPHLAAAYAAVFGADTNKTPWLKQNMVWFAGAWVDLSTDELTWHGLATQAISEYAGFSVYNVLESLGGGVRLPRMETVAIPGIRFI